jgi:hypothetical protein
VVNDGSQLHAVALAAEDALSAETLRSVADAGYYNGETLKACEADGTVAPADYASLHPPYSYRHSPAASGIGVAYV